MSRAALASPSARDRRGGDHHRQRPWCSSRWSIAVLLGMFNNPYAGLVVFIAVPAARSCSACC